MFTISTRCPIFTISTRCPIFTISTRCPIFTISTRYGYVQGCHGTWKTWKKGNFLIKSGKTLKNQGKKLKKHQRKVREYLYYLCVVSGMHKIASSGQNFKGHCLAYLLNLLSTLLRRSGNFHE